MVIVFKVISNATFCIVFTVYRNFECFRLLVLGGADLCFAKASNGAGEPTCLLNGILRYSCDLRYLELLHLCGGIRGENIENYVHMYKGRTDGVREVRQECLEYLQENKCTMGYGGIDVIIDNKSVKLVN